MALKAGDSPRTRRLRAQLAWRGCPFQAGATTGFTSFAERLQPPADKVRGKAERFAGHYAQATLFYRSQTPAERRHIINAFRFELSKVQTPAVRERMVAGLVNVDREMAESIAQGLGLRQLPAALPEVLESEVAPEVTISPALSLTARRGELGVVGRRVAILAADGVDGDPLRQLAAGLTEAGAVPRLVGARLGEVASASEAPIDIDVPADAAPSVLFDGVVVAEGVAADGRTIEFLKDQYRHLQAHHDDRRGCRTSAESRHSTGAAIGERDPGLIYAAAADETQRCGFHPSADPASPLRA